MSATNESDDGSDLFVSFENIVEGFPQGILITDSAEVIQYANPWMHTITRSEWGELAGRSLTDVFPDAGFAIAGESGAPRRPAPREFEVELSDPEGSQRWYSILTLPLERDGESPALWLCTVRDVTAQKLAEDGIREAALRDPLTYVGNRTLLLERLLHAIARSKRHPRQKFAVLFLDLDHFKLVNDSLGHAAGDALLVAFSKRLQSFLRPEDTVARIGGDEFVILLDSINDFADAAGVADRIRDDLAKPILVGERPIQVAVSIGIVEGSGAETADQLLLHADRAMYTAKRNGGGRYKVFDGDAGRPKSKS